MYEIVTILGIIYLLYRIKFFYKEGNYNQVKSFVSILISLILLHLIFTTSSSGIFLQRLYSKFIILH